MELRHLQHFVVVAEELHFARAAARLGMEQSPLSHSIRRLEGELKVRLFQRTTRRTWLTRAGTRFYKDAKRILADVDAAAAALRKEDDDAPPVVRLALGEDLASGPFTRLLFRLEHHAPPVTVDVRELSHAEAARLVGEGGGDVALTLDRRPVDGLRQRRAWAEPLMLVVPIGHALAERDSVTLGEIGCEKLALPRADMCPGYLAQVEELFERHQVKIADRVSVLHWNTAVSFAATGRAVALCPSSLVSGAITVAIVPIDASDAELVTWILYSEPEDSPASSLVIELAEEIDRDPESLVASGPAT